MINRWIEPLRPQDPGQSRTFAIQVIILSIFSLLFANLFMAQSFSVWTAWAILPAMPRHCTLTLACTYLNKFQLHVVKKKKTVFTLDPQLSNSKTECGKMKHLSGSEDVCRSYIYHGLHGGEEERASRSAKKRQVLPAGHDLFHLNSTRRPAGSCGPQCGVWKTHWKLGGPSSNSRKTITKRPPCFVVIAVWARRT